MAPALARGRAVPYALAVTVTVLWSSSYVLIKLGLQTLPPVYFATVRYALAFALLATADLALRRGPSVGSTPRASRKILVAGILGYTVAQGFQYVGLFYLPAITTSLILTFNPIFVLVLGAAFLGRGVRTRELGGMLLALAGALVFFYERFTWQGNWFGVLITVSSGLGWASYVLIARELQTRSGLNPLRLTSATMGVGVAGLVALTFATGEFAPLNAWDFAVIVWLATVNTALAFYLWNKALASIPAYHLTVLQNVMMVEIALFALAFLGESVTAVMAVGMAMVLVGVVLVQVKLR